MMRSGASALPATVIADGSPPQRSSDHAGRELEPGQHEVGVDAALEAVAGVRIDPELAAGLRDVDLVPQRRLDQHVGGGLRATARLAAHDARERLDAVLVGDHADGLIERVDLAIEGKEAFAEARAPHRQVAVHLGDVEHVQRAAAVVGDEVGDVDQRVDRAKPDRDQPALQPGGRGAVLDAAHEPQREGRAERGRRAEIERDLDRAGEAPFHRLDRGVLELAHVGGGEVARDAVHAGAVGAVGREVDLDHRVVEPGPGGVVGADRRIRRQVDDALVVVGQLQLELRHQHAAALDAADLADAERHILARNEGAGRHEHALHAGARVGGAAHHLHRIAAAGFDQADAQPVGVGMLLGRDHAADDERGELLAAVGDALDLEPDHCELVDELVERLIGVEVLLEPGEGEFHGAAGSLCSLPRSVCSLPRLRGRVREGVDAMAAAIVSRTPRRLVITS